MGLGPSIVIRLSQALKSGSYLYFDRYFSSLPLFDVLNDVGLLETGTIMKHRIKDVHLSEKN